ncbi:MAG: PAS domain-containing sensor histidine kinase, partial [Candidatus Korobacteraceae bacterium]
TIARKTLGFYRDSMQLLVPIRKVVADAIDVFRSRLDNLRIDARVEIEEARHLEVPGDIAQVLINLLGNALDASQAGQSVRIWAGERDGAIAIDVEDEGSGIPEELRGRIFEPFFTTKNAYGTGLGLWVSKEIVEGHGGSLRVVSEAKGEHRVTCFTVVLPKSAAAVKSASLK